MLTSFQRSIATLVTWVLAALVLSGVDAYAQTVALKCKITKIVVNGSPESPSQPYSFDVVFNYDEQWVRQNGAKVDAVVITKKKINYRWRGSVEIDRTTWQLHSSGQVGNSTIDNYGDCEEQ